MKLPIASGQDPAKGRARPVGAKAAAGNESRAGNWRRAGIAVALSVCVPGSGHVYLGSYARGAIWSAVFLGIALPGAIFSYIVWSTWDVGVILSIGAFLAAFLLGCGVGPARRGFRSASRDLAGRVARPAVWVLESYVAAVALGTTLEVRWFLESCFDWEEVKTAALAPLFSRGDAVTVLLSSYVRPVHGDVVLCRASWTGPEREAAGTVLELGRVLAKPGDSIQARQGKLIVNGITLELARNDQRWDLEKAGRRERRRRALSSIPLFPFAVPQAGSLEGASRLGRLSWEGIDWGPFVLPRDTSMILPDESASAPVSPGEAPAPPAGGPPSLSARFQGQLVQKADILGRAVR